MSHHFDTEPGREDPSLTLSGVPRRASSLEGETGSVATASDIRVYVGIAPDVLILLSLS